MGRFWQIPKLKRPKEEMPAAAEFARGFGLQKRALSKSAGYRVSDISIQHHQVEQYLKYTYPIRITFACEEKCDMRQLAKAVGELTAGERIIYSQYGNPYVCTISNGAVASGDDGTTLVYTAEGLGIRSYEIPKRVK